MGFCAGRGARGVEEVNRLTRRMWGGVFDNGGNVAGAQSPGRLSAGSGTLNGRGALASTKTRSGLFIGAQDPRWNVGSQSSRRADVPRGTSGLGGADLLRVLVAMRRMG